MRITILFGGSNRERLVSVASAQALHQALPEADLWWWDVEDKVHVVQSRQLLEHARPFEDEFKPGTRGIPLEQALDQAKAEGRVLVLGLHGGSAENGELQVMCEARGVPFTGSGSASSHLAFDKIAAKHFAALGGVMPPANLALDNIDEAFAEYGRLIAKPARDGSSYGLIFVNAKQDLIAVRNAAKHEEYVIEPYIA
ncbi:MAG: D-alanine--D-alanine ligase, partial [Bradyrhizobium sp.]|nr:D-alanine--D-alanine ligase [Bradyrhizobium sp.]